MTKVLALTALLCAMVTIASGTASAEDKFFNSDGVRVRYVDQGVGEAIVLLHGGGASVEVMWGETGVIDALAKRHRVVALDIRGYGKSDKPHDPSAYGSKMADDVVRLLDHLGVRRAHVVGYSLGARITSWLIVNRPGRLITATLGASTYFADTPEQRRAFEEEAKVAESGPNFERLKRENPGMADEQVRDLVARMASTNDPLAVAAANRGSTGLFVTEVALEVTKVPVLHIIGSLDTTRLAASRHLKNNVLPSAEFLIVEGATHAGPQGLFRRREFVEAVERFIDRHRGDL